ncbi:hypothetical protein BpHYR1_022664 [Brachionus plicatilis]|uniref:Uncharacterized protein n=1 Tax=Brachionus plicatilis TaxID=10195 RepID=A0A3M7SJE3_BRAPC|nr:hypothetical protein BpHYR1_022664 [Brachionus plicatilis]
MMRRVLRFHNSRVSSRLTLDVVTKAHKTHRVQTLILMASNYSEKSDGSNMTSQFIHKTIKHEVIEVSWETEALIDFAFPEPRELFQNDYFIGRNLILNYTTAGTLRRKARLNFEELKKKQMTRHFSQLINQIQIAESDLNFNIKSKSKIISKKTKTKSFINIFTLNTEKYK